MATEKKCPACRGFGYTKGGPEGPWEKFDCRLCAGTGKITSHKEFEFDEHEVALAEVGMALGDALSEVLCGTPVKYVCILMNADVRQKDGFATHFITNLGNTDTALKVVKHVSDRASIKFATKVHTDDSGSKGGGGIPV